MTRINAKQEKYLARVERSRSHYDRLAREAALARAKLDAVICRGHELGISTYRLAKAAGFTQPRIYQLIDAAKQAESDAKPLDEGIYRDPHRTQEIGQQP